MTATLSAPSTTDALPVVKAHAVAIAGDKHAVRFRFNPETTSEASLARFVTVLEQSNLVLAVHSETGSVTAHIDPVRSRVQLVEHLTKRHMDIVHLQTRSR